MDNEKTERKWTRLKGRKKKIIQERKTNKELSKERMTDTNK